MDGVGESAKSVIRNKRDSLKGMISKEDLEASWDKMRAEDVPAELVEYVRMEIALGKNPSDIRNDLGIRSALQPAWKKTMAALKLGRRIDGIALFEKWNSQNDKLADKLFRTLDFLQNADIELIEIYLKTPKDAVDENDVNIRAKLLAGGLRQFSKEFIGLMDNLSKGRERMVKIGKEMGIFMDAHAAAFGGGQGQGVTIHVHSTVPTPDQETIDAHHKKQAIIIEDAKVVEDDGKS